MLKVIIISQKVSVCFRGESEPWGMTMNRSGNDFAYPYKTLGAMRAQNRCFSHFGIIPAVIALEGVLKQFFICGLETMFLQSAVLVAKTFLYKFLGVEHLLEGLRNFISHESR